MAYYLMAPDDKPTKVAPSLGEEEPGNPTVLPLEVLKQFQFTFLIRHPRRAIPSYYRCTVPPLDEVTGFYDFMPNEAGYKELVRFFDYLIKENIVDKDNLVVIDADDLLDNPEKTIRLYCEKTGIDFKPEMLEWNEEDCDYATAAFQKWNGWHNDAIKSSALRPRTHHQKTLTTESEDKDWIAKYGAEAHKVIRKTVEDNVADYEYLKQFALPI
ncbi:P-loop containing nucleoside triphosphate hydrolase protein [Fusarium tricinctum]|uniref:P-loop containing nucleoside triphosphate hydrolase protein n=1 Tax=Fusarium tricinctum TaxID=61284 RepID=A0A8K0SBJ5_9HYPO|nr:P-loop containing nucleoside triphosphate hydrolase protein [Fusarium tricinctum]